MYEYLCLISHCSWAYSIVDGKIQTWANYKRINNNIAQTGIAAYNNPYVVYDSQIIHVLVLQYFWTVF